MPRRVKLGLAFTKPVEGDDLGGRALGFVLVVGGLLAHAIFAGRQSGRRCLWDGGFQLFGRDFRRRLELQAELDRGDRREVVIAANGIVSRSIRLLKLRVTEEAAAPTPRPRELVLLRTIVISSGYFARICGGNTTPGAPVRKPT